MPRRAPTRGSCKGASPYPRRERIGSNHLASRTQNVHSASKKSQPLACRPFPSVYSLVKEIMALSVSTGLLLVASQQSDYFPAKFSYSPDRACRHMQDLIKQAAHDG